MAIPTHLDGREGGREGGKEGGRDGGDRREGGEGLTIKEARQETGEERDMK